jgi:hypothetical protein
VGTQAAGNVQARVKRITYKGAAYELELLLDDATCVRASLRETDLVSVPREGEPVNLEWEQRSATFVPGD